MDQPEYKCNICQKVFKSAAGLKTHTTSKKVPCTPPQLNAAPVQPPPAKQQPTQQRQTTPQRQPQPAQQPQRQQPNQQQNQNKSQNNKSDEIGALDFAKQIEDLVASLTSKQTQQTQQNQQQQPKQNSQQQPNRQQPNRQPPQNNQQQNNNQLSGMNLQAFNEGMNALQKQFSQPQQNQSNPQQNQQAQHQQNQQLNNNQQIQLRQQHTQQPSPQQAPQDNQLANVSNNNTNTVTTKNFLNGKEMPSICSDPNYEPMKDYSISPHERFQRLVMKVMNEVTTEDNCKYANLGDPHNLGRFVDRLNKVTGTYCMVNGNSNGQTIAPIMPSQSSFPSGFPSSLFPSSSFPSSLFPSQPANDDWMYDMYLRNLLSEVREEQRQKEREKKEADEKRRLKAKAKDEYIDAEKKRAYGSDTMEKEREIISKLVYDLICNQLKEFIIPDDDDIDVNEKRKYLEKKILYMKRKTFFIGNMQDIITKIFLYDIEYQMKMSQPGTAKYNEEKYKALQEKYENEKNTFEEMSEDDDKLDDYLRYRIYNKLFASLVVIFMTSSDDSNPDEHNEMLMTVARLRNDIEFYVFDKRKRIDDTMRVLMNYDDDKYRKIQHIIFSTLELTDKTTSDILDQLESQEEKLAKETASLTCDIPTEIKAVENTE